MVVRRKRVLRRRAVSNVLTALLLVIIAIAAAGFGIWMMKQQTENLTQITSIDASQSRLYVNPTTGNGSLTLVFTNTGTTTVTIQAGRIGQQGLANITFVKPVQIKYKNAAGTVITVKVTSVTTSDPARSGVTLQGLVLASQTSATIQFTGLSGISAALPPNNEYAVTIYTTGAEVFTFKIVAETSGA
jgi:flagellin-like protein